MKRLSNILLIIAVAFIGFVVFQRPDWIVIPPSTHYDVLALPTSCPAGTEDIGDGICKPQPTGCAYGDSIALDSGKCEPPQSISVYNANQQTETATPEPFVGK